MDDIQKRENVLFEQNSKLIDEAHKYVRTTIDTVMVCTYLESAIINKMQHFLLEMGKGFLFGA